MKDLEYRRLLRQTQTEPEDVLWDLIRDNKIDFKFRRQHPIDKYILDFYCSKLRLNIEIDGKIHEFKEDTDYIRDSFLLSKSITVLRIPAGLIYEDPQRVLDSIKDKISTLVK